VDEGDFTTGEVNVGRRDRVTEEDWSASDVDDDDGGERAAVRLLFADAADDDEVAKARHPANENSEGSKASWFR
jgi:hypothetical protein